jgi:hypothetical protein
MEKRVPQNVPQLEKVHLECRDVDIRVGVVAF